MKNIYRNALMCVVLLTIACSGASEVTNKNTSTTNALYPSWYGAYEFSSDTSGFYARATAVSSDSETAKLRAEKEARALLESYIAKELEDVRSELERDGSNIVKEPNFILMLRNAHYKIEEQATLTHSESVINAGSYRGFARVEIGKQEVGKLIETGLGSNNRYQKEFTESAGFKDFIK